MVKADQESSWGLSEMIRLRNEVRAFLKFEIGDGSFISLWLDYCWHPDGVLHTRYGFWVVYDAASNLEAKVSSVKRKKLVLEAGKI